MDKIINVLFIFLLLPLSLAEKFCLDNLTLAENKTIIVNQDFINITLTQPCEYGCDPFWRTCKFDPVKARLILIAIVVAIIFSALILRRYI